MSYDINCSQFMGRSCGEPRVGEGKSGTKYCNYTLAVNNGKKPTLFVQVTTWGAQAERDEQYVSKGKYVFVSGTIDVKAYARKDGNPAATVSMDANYVRYYGSSEDEDSVPPGYVEVQADGMPY